MNIRDDNRLEELLRLAATEPAYRPRFYTALLESEVFIIGSTAVADSPGRVSLQAGSHVHIQHWEKSDGTPVIPFFTSLAVLQSVLESETTYLRLPARSLFEMTLGTILYLNPKSDYGKEFLADEVKSLLSAGVSQPPVQRVVEKDTRVMLGQPAHYPAKMVDSLTQLFSTYDNVNAAWLALMLDPSVDEKPHLIIGIDAEGDVAQLLRAAGNVAADTVPKGDEVDICLIGEVSGGLGSYFVDESEPFYEKSWGEKLNSSVPPGRA